MIITKISVATYAERLLEVFEENQISSLEMAAKAINSEFEVREILPDRVLIRLEPSNFDTYALKISYLCPNFEGIPLELVINPQLRYRQVILKCADSIAGYTSFNVDGYGNLMQFKKSYGVDWKDSLRDVEALRS